MEAAQAKLWRAVRREVSHASRVGPSNSSSASLSSLASGEDNDLTAEFIATAQSVNAALARAVAEEVEEQLTDILMCLGEETTKASILEHALGQRLGLRGVRRGGDTRKRSLVLYE